MKQVIKQMFTDHWREFEKKYEKRIRPVVKKEVEKLLRCGDLDYGHIEYTCYIRCLFAREYIKCNG